MLTACLVQEGVRQEAAVRAVCAAGQGSVVLRPASPDQAKTGRSPSPSAQQRDPSANRHNPKVPPLLDTGLVCVS